MTTCLADLGAKYRIRVQGRLEPLRAARLGDMTPVVQGRSGAADVTELTGWLADQAALMGVLEQ
ncbi:MAG: hypothetical protein ACM3H9_07095, partial [Rhodospirillaceae bacterium]